MEPTSVTFNEVKSVVIKTLGVEDRAEAIGPVTPLFGSMPELDSMAIVQLVYAIEDRFGLTINDDEITAELFETLGTLAAFVEDKLR
jgi:acyl carrier protein